MKGHFFLTSFFIILQYLLIKDTMTSFCVTAILFQVAKTKNLSEHTVETEVGRTFSFTTLY